MTNWLIANAHGTVVENVSVSRTCSLMVHPAAGDTEDTELHALNRFRRPININFKLFCDDSSFLAA